MVLENSSPSILIETGVGNGVSAGEGDTESSMLVDVGSGEGVGVVKNETNLSLMSVVSRSVPTARKRMSPPIPRIRDFCRTRRAPGGGVGEDGGGWIRGVAGGGAAGGETATGLLLSSVLGRDEILGPGGGGGSG